MIHRRSLIAAAASAPIAGLAGSFAQATPVDPHPVWLEQWRQAREAWHTIDPDAEGGRQSEIELECELDRLEALICTTPAQTGKGVLAQFRFALADNRDFLTKEGVWQDMHIKLFASIETALEAAA
ncbi:hypothetical protein NBRC116598_21450 [Pseudophaeobacter arcticus]|uniref:Twin-arginine translocation pathway signal n=1 Tax=Pseudophaeobacter arcticus TaxID=385492 RepID=A0ABQ0ALF3_9RHOB